jgi:anti-sigma-K factor RskA
VLVTNGLHAPAAGQAYQVWFLSGGQLVPNSLFTVGRAGQAASVLRVGTPLQRYDNVAVTPEPFGGSPAPTSHIVLAGSLA